MVSAIAAIGARSYISRAMNSPAMCCASPALPPLPQTSSLPPPRRLATIASAMSAITRRYCGPASNATIAATLSAR